ncbi:MAG TPA: adenylate/guanylate cyclase domain-containing protein [Candidatus Polarisedimenticolia bacterium]|nr:adenylate/guanylate cyclase domain-containing protein [Candidatus Polarisedimenticolia bacterium]
MAAERPNMLKRFLQAFAVSLAASGVVIGMASLGLWRGLDAAVFDVFSELRGSDPPADVLIVAIDDETFSRMGRRQPVDRRALADLIRSVAAQGPRVIGVGILLEDPSDPEADAALLAAVGEAESGQGPPVILARNSDCLGEGDTCSLTPLFSARLERLAAVDLAMMDEDGVVRRVVRATPETGGAAQAFAEAIALGRRPAGSSPERQGRGIRITAGPLIRFAGPAGSIPTLPAWPLLDPGRAAAAREPAPILRGRRVLIGATFAGSGEPVRTPVGEMSRAELQANLVSSYANDGWIGAVHPFWSTAAQLTLCVLAGLCHTLLRPGQALLASLAAVATLALPFGYWSMVRQQAWFDASTPILSAALVGGVMAQVRRGRRRRLLEGYLSPELARRILREGESLRPRSTVATVLFTDLRGFTTLSESIAPEQVVSLLNRYFAIVTEEATRHQGAVCDLLGDGVMVVFGAPLVNERHADSAVHCARRLVPAMRRLNEELKREGLAQLSLGVGIHTGQLVAGEVGTARRRKYTVIGDAVNVASRVEGLNKELGTEALLTEATREHLSEDHPLRDRRSHHVKGRSAAVHVYELLPESP